MAKEVALEKRAKISEAQKMMLLAVLGAALFLGAALSLSNQIIKRISFNAEVIMEEDKSIVAYSNAIKQTGICKKPNGDVYTEEEIKNCVPDAISVDEIPGTLRANILTNVASNKALLSVPTTSDRSCINPGTHKLYTYKELEELYDENYKKGNTEKMAEYSNLIKTCSALRVIPDALPAYYNNVALLASLNKLFSLAGWEPESLSPSSNGDTNVASSGNLRPIQVKLVVEDTVSETTLKILNNLEHSIREFTIDDATIEWSANGLNLKANATAYYVDPAVLKETTTVIKGVKDGS